MADNVIANPGAGGATFATDDDGTAQHPYSKIEFGADGTYTKVADADGARLPVSIGTSANIGGVTETAPATDTASSGLNGRLQRIAQRLTTLITLLPTSVGQKNKAGSLSVTLASDEDALPITDNGGSITVDGTLAVSGTVDVTGSTVTATVTGTVTANAGTNLNTSALALEAGGNLAAASASLSIVDDWDETDRAKVNVIVGQAGVTGGAGAVAANTPRVTHASDDPVTTAVQIMDDWDESDRAKVNPIVGQAGVAAGTGVDGVTVQRVTLATNVGLPAGTNVLGSVTTAGSGKTLKRAVVTLTADSDVVALVSSKRIKVYAYEMQSETDGMTLELRSNNASGTKMGIPWKFNAREGAAAHATEPPTFIFATVAGEALYANLTGTGTISVAVSYWDDDAT